ncbi:MAG: DMT family transporter [Synergistaceae bacterium]|jgi:drug/metabolite transporter (DMT)-like permease|nr:DMT family transporter [Synergistaceae bacterium]
MNTISLRRARVEILLCVCLWSASFAMMKTAVAEIAPITAVWFRVAFGFLVLTSVIVARGEFSIPVRGEILPLIFLGLIGVVFHQDIQFVAMRTAGIANANWMIAATPSIVAFLGWFFLKEKMSFIAIIGLAVSAFGVLLVVGLGTKGLGMFSVHATGDLLMFISAINWAVFQIVSRKLLGNRSPSFTAFWINVFAIMAQSALFLVFPPSLDEIFKMSGSAWFAVLFLGCVCSGLCYTLWYDGLSVMPAAQVVVFQFLQPVAGAVIAYFLAGERFTVFLLAGGVLIIIGVWMVNHQRSQK